MKTKILTGALIVSLLLNVAGLVFFILYLKLQGHYRSLQHQHRMVVQNVSAVRGATIANDAINNDRVMKRQFASLVDGQEDQYGLIAPKGDPSKLNGTLLVYLHGMGSNYLEPFMYPAANPIAFGITDSHQPVGVLSCSCRKEAAWGNDLALADLTQNIREVLNQYPFKNIVLMGTSMGGCVALNYAAVAPPDVKKKIEGIVAVEGAGNLAELAKLSDNASIAVAMTQAFGATPEQNPLIYKEKSFVSHASELPRGVRVAVVSAREDKVVPPALQAELMQTLATNAVVSRLIETDGGHGVPPTEVYQQAYDYVTSRN